MGYLYRTNILKLSVMIAIAIIMLSCVAVAAGTNFIVEAEQQAIATQTQRLASKCLEHYQFQTDIDACAMSWINDGNKASIVSIINEATEPHELLEVHINFDEVDLYQPLSSLPAILNMVYEYSVEHDMMEFCEKHQIDYNKAPIETLDAELFLDLLDCLQNESGVAL